MRIYPAPVRVFHLLCAPPLLLMRRTRANAAESDAAQFDSTGCLITEVVFPGFHWEDHKYLTAADLEGMWGGKAGWEAWSDFVRA